MKVLYLLLVLSLAAIVIAVAATVWRLRWHLRRPGDVHNTRLKSFIRTMSRLKKVRQPGLRHTFHGRSRCKLFVG